MARSSYSRGKTYARKAPKVKKKSYKRAMKKQGAFKKYKGNTGKAGGFFR